MNNCDTNGLEAACDVAGVAGSSPPLEFDVAKYAPHLTDIDMNEEQKRELLGTIWAIMQTFVNLGFDVAKADLYGQLFGDFNEAADCGPEGVESSSSSNTETGHDQDGRKGGP